MFSVGSYTEPRVHKDKMDGKKDQGRDYQVRESNTHTSPRFYNYTPITFSSFDIVDMETHDRITDLVALVTTYPARLVGYPDFSLSKALRSRNTVSKSLMAFIPKRQNRSGAMLYSSCSIYILPLVADISIMGGNGQCKPLGELDVPYNLDCQPFQMAWSERFLLSAKAMRELNLSIQHTR